MCSCYGHRTDFSPWRDTAHAFAWRHRDALRAALGLAAVLAALGGLAAYQLAPTDLERAEADLRKARAVVIDLQEEGVRAGEDARRHARNAAEGRRAAADTDESADPGYRGYCESLAAANKQVSAANWARRDALIHLTAGYLRLLAEAECEILRAKDARDHGTPYTVAPRVRDLLAPVLNTR